MMPVPKTSVHEDYGAAARERKIRSAGHISAMKPIPIAHAMYETAYDHFGAGVTGPDRPHRLAALDGRHRRLIGVALDAL
jgi:hypothetical protein